jgi:hypothetical protein
MVPEKAPDDGHVSNENIKLVKGNPASGREIGVAT